VQRLLQRDLGRAARRSGTRPSTRNRECLIRRRPHLILTREAGRGPARSGPAFGPRAGCERWRGQASARRSTIRPLHHASHGPPAPSRATGEDQGSDSLPPDTAYRPLPALLKPRRRAIRDRAPPWPTLPKHLPKKPE
jgi:hypothetical protein